MRALSLRSAQPGKEIGDLAGLLMVLAEEDAHVLVEGVEDPLGLGAAAFGEEEHADTAAQVESGFGGVPGRVGHDFQKQVAQAMETTQSAVSDFERLGGDPRLTTIMRYARAVGMAVATKAHVVDASGPSRDAWEPLSHKAEPVPVAGKRRGAAWHYPATRGGISGGASATG